MGGDTEKSGASYGFAVPVTSREHPRLQEDMKRVALLLAFVAGAAPIFGASSAAAPRGGAPVRTVAGQILTSDRLPPACIRVSPKLRYVGRHTFTIGKIAAGERFIFAEANGSIVQKLFIAQFESMLPGGKETYRYRADDRELGGLNFKHGVFAFSNRAAVAENPAGEASLTAKFLERLGLTVPDEWLVDRYATVGDSTRRNEMILFVMEPLSAFGVRLSALPDPESPSAILSEPMVERSRRIFEIVPCGTPIPSPR